MEWMDGWVDHGNGVWMLACLPAPACGVILLQPAPVSFGLWKWPDLFILFFRA